MEVHHHSHTSRKKWTHYFWEFLMLFLAVFCGFLAENQREHFIEHQREKVFMESLLEDLKSDTMDLTRDTVFWTEQVRSIDTIKAELNKKPGERNPVLLYRCVAKMGFVNSFLYQDRTVNQLKNAGNFRLIRKKNVSDALSKYDSYILNELKPIEADFGDNYRDYLNLQDKFFNSEYFTMSFIQPQRLDSIAVSSPAIIVMRNRDEDLLFEYYNKLNTRARQLRFRNLLLKSALRRAINLISLVKKEYHIE